MATQKIAISVPPFFLKKLDFWAKKTGKSRSRFIVEEMSSKLMKLEDEEITKLYNEAYGKETGESHDSKLAEEMLNISAVQEMEDKW